VRIRGSPRNPAAAYDAAYDQGLLAPTSTFTPASEVPGGDVRRYLKMKVLAPVLAEFFAGEIGGPTRAHATSLTSTPASPAGTSPAAPIRLSTRTTYARVSGYGGTQPQRATGAGPAL
jgi:hypothetical protein